MKKQIVSISPIQTAKVIAVVYFVFSLPFVVLMSIGMAFSPGPKSSALFFIAAPFIYLVFGFIFTALGALVYNLVASRFGGIEYTSSSSN